MYISISRGDQCDALLMFCDVVVILHHVISVQMYFESDQKFITPIALPIGRSAEHVYFSDWTNASTLTSDQKRRFRQCEEYSMYLATLDVVSHFIVQHSRVLILRSCDLLAMPFASPSPSRYFLQVEVHSLEWLVSKLILLVRGSSLLTFAAFVVTTPAGVYCPSASGLASSTANFPTITATRHFSSPWAKSCPIQLRGPCRKVICA